jgi:hypothetical protein
MKRGGRLAKRGLLITHARLRCVTTRPTMYMVP